MPQIANGDSGAAARAAINFVLPRTAAFATTPPLDGYAVMAPQTVAGALAFAAPASPVLGAQCLVRLTADGTNVPSFSGFVEHGSSAGYLNTAGIVNLVRFWHDGVTSWMAIGQALNVVPLVMQAAQVSAADPTHIVVTFPVTLNAGAVPAAAAFAITNSGGADMVSAVAIAGQTVTLTKSRTTLAGDTIQLAYTPPGTNALADTNGNPVGASTITVANGVAPGANYLRLGSLANMTESANPSGGYDYSETATGAYGPAAGRGIAAKVLPANTDGWVQFTLAGVATSGPILGFQSGSTFTDYPSLQYGCYVDDVFRLLQSGNSMVGGNGTALPLQAGTVMRLRRTAGTVTVEGSNDGAATWTVMHTFSGTSTATLYIAAMIGTTDPAAKMVQLRASSSVA